jgi:hypothetical protein
MLTQAETQFGRKLNGDEVTMIMQAHQRGMTLGQMLEAIDAIGTQETPEPPPPKTYRFEAAGRQVQTIGVVEDG